jgi:hypothetical protein
VIDPPDATDGLVEYFRNICGEQLDWDGYRHAMVRQFKSLIRLEIEGEGRSPSRVPRPPHRRPVAA